MAVDKQSAGLVTEGKPPALVPLQQLEGRFEPENRSWPRREHNESRADAEGKRAARLFQLKFLLRSAFCVLLRQCNFGIRGNHFAIILELPSTMNNG